MAHRGIQGQVDYIPSVKMRIKFGVVSYVVNFHSVQEMEGSTTRVGLAKWEEEWVMCSWNLCKCQKR